MINLQTARKFEDLLGPDVEAGPYDYVALFKVDGFFGRQRAARRFTMLKAIDAKLRRILFPGEKVYFITRGTTVGGRERFVVGWLAYYLDMRALIFTSHRAVLLQIDSRKRPTGLASQMSYSAVASVRTTWSGLCRVKFMNESSYDFQHVPRADRKLLTEFLNEIVQGSNAPFQQAGAIEHLCPHCFGAVAEHPASCPTCQGGFKSARRAGLLSLLFPGAGDWYLGHRTFALMEMLIACVLWIFLVAVPLLKSQGRAEAAPSTGYWILAGLALGATHMLAGKLAGHFTRKGHYPWGPTPEAAGRLHPFAMRSMPKPDMRALKKLTLARPPAPREKPSPPSLVGSGSPVG